MTRSYEKISPADFSAAEGVDDWRVLWWQAFALFRTKNFVTGLALVNEIGRLAEEADHHPDVNLRYGVLEIRLSTHDTMSLTDADLDLARKISAAARALGVEGDPGAIRTWEFALDALDVDAVRRFWAAVLGYRLVGDTDIADPVGLYPPVYVQQMDAMREGRNRIHIDLGVPHDVAKARVEAALAAGGRLVSDEFAPAWWTLADPEGNEVDVAT
ncbi:VOC family protein, partial [Nocardioides ginsengisoli]